MPHVTSPKPAVNNIQLKVERAENGLPEDVLPYKRTAIFDLDNLPAALCRNHCTKPGVWGVIHVIEGRLAYTISSPNDEQILEPNMLGIIRPEQLHYVCPLGNVRFFVEFHR